jgi:hypothetical protein
VTDDGAVNSQNSALTHRRYNKMCAPVVAVRKNLDLVWVWFYNGIIPHA